MVERRRSGARAGRRTRLAAVRLAGRRRGQELWAARADEAGAELDLSFWDDKRGMFNNASPCILQACTDPFNYWWQAHAADALLDRYERTKDDGVRARVGELFEGIRDRNAGVWTNGYYDDMEWMALAWLRAYELLGDDKYKAAALELWTDIQGGWNEEMGGGIAWRKEQLDYKNTPANAPAVILAARLHRNFGSQDDLEWALKIYDWQKRTLVDPESGLVWDGINRTGDGAIDKDWKFTYGQGVFIGAAMELYEATGEEKYRDDVNKTADYVLEAMASPATGLLPNEGDGDGGLFKGVLVRYLTEWAAREPERGGQYGSLILENAASLWDYGRGGEAARFGTSWAQPPDTVVQLSSQISGTMLLEQAAKLERLGFK
ncbi:glycoside hydrolase family 76 protein [Cohnella cellulosilytica]|uniref:glycoside hydrolase family 76 protein n=1 Tax=Cohnella cellulosilytica TaxID=986710 RepID=UPI003607AFD9